ncbi:MAG: triose-phosphate isomerase [Bdellovibrionaceae bacterium]|nr:triose-phosphate isomerase [Pseudobdellovibrionaceae bacterium]
MLKKPFVAANWKMHKNPQEATEFFNDFLSKISIEQMENFAFFPPTIDLSVTSEKLKKTRIYWGAQNIYTETQGAFTGETSAEVVKSLGANMCLVGHSERRSLFGEDDDQVSKKVNLIQQLDMTPMICIGESLVQRKSGKTFDVVEVQLIKALKDLDSKKEFIIAYEPVWAIGTGQVATPEMAEEVHLFIREKLSGLFGKAITEKTLILYGGSVKPENAAELYKQKNIDGFLVGGASLKVDAFLQIYRALF